MQLVKESEEMVKVGSRYEVERTSAAPRMG